MPPFVEIKMPLRHYDMLEKYVDKKQGNGCPPNGVPTVFSMGGATVFLELESFLNGGDSIFGIGTA